MQINFTIYATGATIINNILRFIAYQADTPTVPVQTQESPPTQVFPQAVTMNVPNPVPHLVSIYSTPDASVGTLMSNFLYDPTYTSVEIRYAEQIVVGGIGPYDPAIGSTQINIPDAVGWTYWFERRANGGTQADGEYTVLLTGGVELTRVGDTFGDGEIMFIHFYPKISTATPTFNYLNLYTDILPITSSTILDVTYTGKLLEITESTTSSLIAMPSLTDIPDMKIFSFTTFMGNQKQSKITGAFKYMNQPMGAIYMGAQESFTCIKKGDAYHVQILPKGMFDVGTYHYTDSKTLYPNRLYCDGASVLILDYPRLDNWLSLLSPGLVYSTLSAKNLDGLPAKGMWVRDTVAGLIYLPDKRGMYMRALPEARADTPFSLSSPAKPGITEVGQNLDHNHTTDPKFNRLGMRAADFDGNGTANNIGSSDPGSKYRVGAMSSGGNDGNWPGSVIKNNGGVQSTVTGTAHYVLVDV